MATPSRPLTARGVSVFCAIAPFALERLHELDGEHRLYQSTKPRPGEESALLLTPLELIDRLAALVPRPRIHRHFGVLARTAAHGKFPRRPQTAGVGPRAVHRSSPLSTPTATLVQMFFERLAGARFTRRQGSLAAAMDGMHLAAIQAPRLHPEDPQHPTSKSLTLVPLAKTSSTFELLQRTDRR